MTPKSVPSGAEIPDFCLVVPCYDEEDALPHFFAAVMPALDEMTNGSWRLVCVDDGSRDNTFRLIAEKNLVEPRVSGVKLSRNFGHQPAVAAGLAYARGKHVGVIDCDLQDPIHVLVAMYKKTLGEELDVCYGVRARRDAPLHLKFGYWAFYKLIGQTASHVWPEGAGDFSIISARCLDTLLRLPEHSRMLRGLRSWVGFRSAGYDYERPARLHGQSKYNMKSLTRLAIQGLIGFSNIPLRVATYVGLLMGMISLLFGAFLVINFFFPWFTVFGYSVGAQRGITTLGVFLATAFSVLFLCIGIIGEYLGVLLYEVKSRPTAVIECAIGDISLDPQAKGVLEARTRGQA
jgi:glycosyltransferase involved in cell wall biosynthesis